MRSMFFSFIPPPKRVVSKINNSLQMLLTCSFGLSETRIPGTISKTLAINILSHMAVPRLYFGIIFYKGKEKWRG